MRSGIWTILYVVALLAASLATFGVGGLFLAALVLVFWAIFFYTLSWTTVFAFILLLLLVIALLTPAIQTAREAAPRNHCINNLKQISLALQAYHDVFGSFPPAYIADENGKPMHSWRVLILPYLEETSIYDAYDFNEPWNGPNNSKLMVILNTFRCPTATTPDTHTNYVAVVGPRTAWPEDESSRKARFVDGRSKTIQIIESHQRSVHWMEPRDVSFDEAVEMLSGDVDSGNSDGHLVERFFCYERSGRMAAFADASVRFLPYGMPRKSAEGLLTVAGGENIDPGNIKFSGSTIRTMKWDRVCTLSLFIALVLLPAPWAWRARAGQRPGDA